MIDIRDVDEIKNKGGATIHQAFTECKKRLNKTPARALADSVGIMAYETDEFILCAKEYICGNIVSCHTELLDRAIMKDLSILMYIKKVDKFYEFNPHSCKANGKVNFRSGIMMTNFHIKLGLNYEVKLQAIKE